MLVTGSATMFSLVEKALRRSTVMKRGKWLGALILLVLLSSSLASAQVQQVMADAQGIT